MTHQIAINEKKMKTKLDKLMQSRALEPFIRHIRFPVYKNLSAGTRIDFEYPITALVGQNGTNKSSVLRALYGAPNGYSLGNLWFSTSVDEIDDGGRSRFIYGYYDRATNSIVEVIKSRIKKGNDPDYWEPSRPLAADGMEKMPEKRVSVNQLGTRWKAIDKEVVYVDFRATISAFDKLFYHSDFDKISSKDHLRRRSVDLLKVINDELKSYKPYKGKHEKIFRNEKLNKDKIDKISQILGRTYTSIRIVEHALFTSKKSTTVILESEALHYSEAFAGSGEFAVVVLVNKVLEATANSLILLDEPEVSLHPAAQTKVMDFLFECCLKFKHQVVISTHSSSIVRTLPKCAIKLFTLNKVIGNVDVLQNINPEESFFYIGDNINKKTIFVEDKLAKIVVEKALRSIGDGFFSTFNVNYAPSGAASLLNNIAIPMFLSKKNDVVFLLDGDQNQNEEFMLSKDIPEGDDDKLDIIIKKILGMDIKIPCDGHNGKPNQPQLVKSQRGFLDFAHNYISYLPMNTPEEFLLNNISGDYKLIYDDINKNNLSLKEIFEEICKCDIDQEYVSSDDIFNTQQRILSKIALNAPELKSINDMLQQFIEYGIIGR